MSKVRAVSVQGIPSRNGADFGQKQLKSKGFSRATTLVTHKIVIMKNKILFLRLLALAFVLCLPGASFGRPCEGESSLIQEMRGIACLNFDLRKAVQQDSLLKRVSNANVFGNLLPNDIVRSEETLSFWSRSLVKRIEEANTKYQEQGRERYTLNITSYPSRIKPGTCEKHKSIDVRPVARTLTASATSAVTGSANVVELPSVYVPLPAGRPPRFFQVRKHKGRFVMCESTKIPYKKRLALYCGSPTEESEKYQKCKTDITPSCSELDKKGALKSDQKTCISLDDFSNLSQDLLMSNTALEWKNCPAGCSYYTQTLQDMYQQKADKGDYCTDSYLIVHCGPKKQEGKYNLNIREVKNLCSDFRPLAGSYCL